MFVKTQRCYDIEAILTKRMAKHKEKTSVLPKISLKAPKLDLHKETRRGIAVVIFIVLAVISAYSLFFPAGAAGDMWSRLLGWLFGVISYVVPVLLGLVAFMLIHQDLKVDQGSNFYFRTYFGILLLTGSIAGLIHLLFMNMGNEAGVLAADRRAGGYLGLLFAVPAIKLLGFWMGMIVLLAFVTIGVLITFNVSITKLFIRQKKELLAKTEPMEVKINKGEETGFVQEKVEMKNPKVDKVRVEDERLRVNTAPQEVKMDAIVVEDRKDWKLPPFDLLEERTADVDSGNIEMNVQLIQKTLKDFGIEVEMGEVNVGPTVTQYTLRPAQGVKLSQIAGLQSDLALALAAQAIRMELPIPGKSLVGIEVPNKSTRIVTLREVMQTQEFVKHKSKLAIALGRDVAGVPMITDLAKMPHMLIAGATGTGKSVAINSLFISLLYRNTPQDVKFIVVDPKRVELSMYNGIPHLLTPPVTDPEKAVNALKWAVNEMDRRYKLLSECGKRNIGEYNETMSENHMPYIVLLVDELADLMAVARADIEAAIVRLAQMARAVGIHLVLATQSPRTDIITGLIKANITSRVAFTVASQIDSRVILDMSGAENLLGNGDLLYTSAEFNKPKRVQGAYIGEKEVRRVVDFFKQQTGAVIYNEEILERPKTGLNIPGFSGSDGSGDDNDPLLGQAEEVVVQMGKASASLLQRRMRVGYARAARLIDLLEAKGIVGPPDGAKPREVYGVIPQAEKAEYGIEETQDDQQGY